MEALGQAFLAVWGALGFDVDLMARYGPRLLSGLGVTLEIVALAAPLGCALAIPLAVCRLEGGPIARNLALGFSTFFRGTPLLAQTFLVYYGAGQFRSAFETIGLWWLVRDAFWCVILTFTLNTAAYQSEIIRGGVRALPAGQREAASALGLGPFALYARVLLPQALIGGLRPLGNELVLLVKASSIASAVTVFDLLGATRYVYGRTLDFSVYLWAALLYLALVEIIRRAVNAIERRAGRRFAAVS
ncbi:ABC transporter permease [Methylopila turkensis]|uniref:Amino acid ABC transporter permease n=1 Tax=Methylopila turkensis TaxID=1437816 RepID=A0A9W6JT27_9HYPH|nr:ABC transporter permease subunit [Methylopila turkensis]GLK81304.1 amino acid ABC transporter permease [Methylopila turkensis]